MFYEAIRDRKYLQDVLEAKKYFNITSPIIMVKKLRYYARFIVVSLLLDKTDAVNDLLDQLASLVNDYNKSFKPADFPEWCVVLSELATFLQAQKKSLPTCLHDVPLKCPNRLVGELLRVDKSNNVTQTSNPLRLQEAIIVGNCENQVLVYNL